MKNKSFPNKNMLTYFWSASARLLSVLSQFVLIACIGYSGGVSATGVYGACFSIASLASVVGSFGQSAAAFREIPRLLKIGKRSDAERQASRAFIVTLTGMVILMIPLVLVTTATFDDFGLAIVCYLLAVGIGLLGVLAAVARSYGYVFFSELQRNAVWRYLAVVVLIVTTVIYGSLSSFTVVFIVSISGISSVFICLLYLKRVEGLSIKAEGVRSYFKGSKVDSKNWRIQSLQAALLNIDVFLAANVLSPAELGAYFIITRIASLVALPLTVTNPVIIPFVSRIAKGEVSSELQKRVRRNTYINVISTIVISVIVMLLFSLLYKVLSGDSNSSKEYFYLLMLLVFVQWSNVVVGPSTMAAQLFDVRSVVIKVILVAVVVQALLVVIFGATYGLYGVIVGVTFARVSVNFCVVYFLYFKAGFNVFTGAYSGSPPI